MESARCAARKKNGDRCRNAVTNGNTVCFQHSGAATIGRPTKFTPETRSKLLEAVNAGVYMHIAAEYAGIHVSTLHEWLERGRTDAIAGRETDFSEFSEEIVRTAAKVEVRALAQIAQAGTEDWRAAAWLAERRYPERYGKRDAHDANSSTVNIVALLGGKQPVDVSLAKRERILSVLEEPDPSTPGADDGGEPSGPET